MVLLSSSSRSGISSSRSRSSSSSSLCRSVHWFCRYHLMYYLIQMVVLLILITNHYHVRYVQETHDNNKSNIILFLPLLSNQVIDQTTVLLHNSHTSFLRKEFLDPSSKIRSLFWQKSKDEEETLPTHQHSSSNNYYDDGHGDEFRNDEVRSNDKILTIHENSNNHIDTVHEEMIFRYEKNDTQEYFLKNSSTDHHHDGYTTLANKKDNINSTIRMMISHRWTTNELNRYYKKSQLVAWQKFTPYQKRWFRGSLKQHSKHLDGLPEWMKLYVRWHRTMRFLYPDDKLYIHSQTEQSFSKQQKRLVQKPGLFIKYCDIRCGGLHDRLSSLDNLLYIAYRTKRILLLKWYSPRPLEFFLSPAYVNFTLPLDPEHPKRYTFRNISNSAVNHDIVSVWHKKYKRRNRYFTKTNATYCNIDGVLYQNALETAESHRDVVETQVIVHKYWGKPQFNMTQDLLNLNDMDNQTNPQVPVLPNSQTFGLLWKLFFQPSQRTQQMIDTTMTELNLQHQSYDAVHCRVRHPGRHNAFLSSTINHTSSRTTLEKLKSEASTHDSRGLPWNLSDTDKNSFTKSAIETAIHAIQCALTLDKNNKQVPTDMEPVIPPIYFFSDSEHLVHHMTTVNTTLFSFSESQQLYQQQQRNLQQQQKQQQQQQQHWGTNPTHLIPTIVSRDVRSLPSVHLDIQKGVHQKNNDAYHAIFVDLYLAASARCITYGVGNFAYLAAKISGTKCLLRHESFSTPTEMSIVPSIQKSEGSMNWYNQQTKGAPLCNLLS